MMARILNDTLGEMLLNQPLDSQEMPGTDEELPSPEKLKFKVLVKAKNVAATDGQRPITQKRSTDGLVAAAQQIHGTTVVPTMVLEPPTSATDTTSTTDSEMDSRLASAKQLVRRVTRRSHGGEAALSGPSSYRSGNASDGLDVISSTRGGGQGSASRTSKQTKKMMSTALASLLIYTIGVKCRGFNKKETYATQHMVSLSEKTALKMIRDATSNEALIKHNRCHLTRIYPSMMSFARLHASRNFVPLDMWAAGCQLVALNWQTTDLGFELNQAMFSRNGRCGYVLKPAALRTKEHGKTLAGKAVRFRLDLSVISAQQLPKKSKSAPGKDRDKQSHNDNREPIDPFVVVSLLAPSCWGKQPLGLLQKASLSGQDGVAAASVAQGQEIGVREKDERRGSDPSSLAEATERTRQGDAVVCPDTTTSIQQATETAKLNSAFSAKQTNLAPTHLLRTPTVKGNGFSPEWHTDMSVLIDVPAGASNELVALIEASKASDCGDGLTHAELERLSRGLLDLCFIRFEVFDDDLDDHPAGEKSATNTAAALNARLTPSGTSSTNIVESMSLLSLDSSTAGSNSFPAENKSSSGEGRSRAGSESSSASSTASIDAESVAAYSVSVGALQKGYRHLPLYDHQLSQYLFSTLFVRSRLRLVGLVDAVGRGKHG